MRLSKASKGLEHELKNIGLSEKEARVYLAILAFGQGTAAEIAKYASINRATTYAVIDDLKKDGLVSVVEKEKKTYFVAESPERLRRLFEMREARFKEGLKHLRTILPELDHMFASKGERPKVRFFEGKEGIAAIREDILNTIIKTIDEIVPLDEAYRFFPPRKSDHRKGMGRRLRHVRFRVIYTSRKGPILKIFKNPSEEAKFIRHEDFPISAEVILYSPTKAALIVYKTKPYGVIIDDELLVHTLKVVFGFLWKSIV